ncbi:MAG: DUF4332 domain-containing protein [Bradymonadales bacterium]|nr:DUF4332 domain-containing protein [Bradymonadales bacterium]
MTENVAKWMLRGLVLSLALALLAPMAFASHYRLAYLEFIDASVVQALEAVGIQTTEDLLARAATAEDRRRLSEETGVSELEILVLVRLAELLQVEGIGPRTAQLLRAAGVVSVADLASRNPEELALQLSAVNAVEQLTGIDPSPENLTEWIAGAGSVPIQVE